MPAEPPPEHRADFYSLSAALTGFSEVELLGTGVGDLYLAFLTRVFPDVMAELLDVWRGVESQYPSQEREAALQETMLADEKLGPFARALIKLWYTATWAPMPEEWSTAYGDHADQESSSMLAVAYPEGLVWRAGIGSHPQAAKPTGFASWAFPPEDTAGG